MTDAKTTIKAGQTEDRGKYHMTISRMTVDKLGVKLEASKYLGKSAVI